MKRVVILLFFGMLLTGCYTSSLTVVGPATGVASGKISETAASSSINYVVKKQTGKSPIEHVLSENQIESLETLINLTNDICFVTYLTVEPNKDDINFYIKDFNERLLKSKSFNLAILGPQQVHINISKLSKNVKLFKSIHAFQDKFLKTSIYV